MTRASLAFSRQAATLAILFASYAAIYFCRADLSVTAPLLIADLHAQGSSIRDATLIIGTLASLGTLAYAFGKFFLSGLVDFFGGKGALLVAMFGASACTVLFASSTNEAAFLATWIGNRLLQSLAWPGLVKVSSKWIPYTAYGSAMAVLSLSYLIGDTVTRGSMGALIAAGLGWRALFFAGAVALAAVALINLFFLKESRQATGLEPPGVNPENVYGSSGAAERPADVRALLVPLMRSSAFWIVCALSFGTTLLRETFATWSPTFLSSVGFSPAQAAGYSALFPASGVASVLLAGWLGDRYLARGRARVTFLGLTLAAGALAALAFVPSGAGTLALGLIVLVGFFNSGPYSYLSGAMALDIGGRKGSAFAAGMIDGVGYLGGALAGIAVAGIELRFGWSGAFLSLAGITGITAACALFLRPRVTHS